MKIQYTKERLSDDTINALAESLQLKGLDMHDSYCERVPKYGFRKITTEQPKYTIRNGRGQTVYESNFAHMRDEFFIQAVQVYKVSKGEYTQTTTVEDWVSPKGTYLTLHESDAKTDTYYVYDGQYQYENDVTMKVSCETGSWVSGFSLTFVITWEAEKVQTKEKIEEMVVATPLNDMGKIQKIIEDSLEEFVEVEHNPVIECHFDAKTESRSECAPDIIKMVRDARKKGE